jgi:hypothetical protein
MAEFTDDIDERPVARDGEPVDRQRAARLVEAAMVGLFEGNSSGRRPLPVSGETAEEAAQNAFVELYEAAVAHPEQWMATPDEVAAELLFAEWLHQSRRALNNWQRGYHKDRATGLERERLEPGGRPDAPAGLDVDAPAPLAWIEDEGLHWDEVLTRFPALLEHDSPVVATLLLRWCTGWDARKIAASLEHRVTAGEVFVRLVRLLRLHPEQWISLAAYCVGRLEEESHLTLTRQADIDAVVGRNGWRDPFGVANREASVELLVEWMEQTGKLPDPLERPEYEWPAWAKRELVARRIATGFASHPRAFSRRRLWAPAESFASIADRLKGRRDVTGDTTRKYFERLRKEPANAWIADLLPGGLG